MDVEAVPRPVAEGRDCGRVPEQHRSVKPRFLVAPPTFSPPQILIDRFDDSSWSSNLMDLINLLLNSCCILSQQKFNLSRVEQLLDGVSYRGLSSLTVNVLTM